LLSRSPWNEKKCGHFGFRWLLSPGYLGVMFSGRSEHDPTDLSYWLRVADNDGSKQAADGDAKAQFFLGLALMRTNLTQFVGRVPIL
jgi:hypothetical protein